MSEPLWPINDTRTLFCRCRLAQKLATTVAIHSVIVLLTGRMRLLRHQQPHRCRRLPLLLIRFCLSKNARANLEAAAAAVEVRPAHCSGCTSTLKQRGPTCSRSSSFSSFGAVRQECCLWCVCVRVYGCGAIVWWLAGAYSVSYSFCCS